MRASQEVPEPIHINRLLVDDIVVQFRATERLICYLSRHLELFGSRPLWQRHFWALKFEMLSEYRKNKKRITSAQKTVNV